MLSFVIIQVSECQTRSSAKPQLKQDDQKRYT